MKVVIEIPDDTFEALRKYVIISGRRSGKTLMSVIFNAVRNGTPLPKGHGRIMDVDRVIKKMEEREDRLKDDRSMYETSCVETALDMFGETIIEADNAESEGKE